jgi:hypothetical protein
MSTGTVMWLAEHRAALAQVTNTKAGRAVPDGHGRRDGQIGCITRSSRNESISAARPPTAGALLKLKRGDSAPGATVSLSAPRSEPVEWDECDCGAIPFAIRTRVRDVTRSRGTVHGSEDGDKSCPRTAVALAAGAIPASAREPKRAKDRGWLDPQRKDGMDVSRSHSTRRSRLAAGARARAR